MIDFELVRKKDMFSEQNEGLKFPDLICPPKLRLIPLGLFTKFIPVSVGIWNHSGKRPKKINVLLCANPASTIKATTL